MKRRILLAALLILSGAGCGGKSDGDSSAHPAAVTLPASTHPVLATAYGRGPFFLRFTTPEKGGIEVVLACTGGKEATVRIARFIGSVTECGKPGSGFESDASNAMPHGTKFTAHVIAAHNISWRLRIERTKGHHSK